MDIGLIIRGVKRGSYLFRWHPKLLFRVIYKRLMVKFLKQRTIRSTMNSVTFIFDLSKEDDRDWCGWAPIEQILFIWKNLCPGDVFIDIGANIGFMSWIAASRAGKSGQVHCFEPVPQVYSRLATFAKENPTYNIFPNQCAIGDKRGTIEVAVSVNEHSGWSTVIPGLLKEEYVSHKIRTPLIQLDDYVREKGINKISFVKIDVEGYEFFVLKGMISILEQYRPIVLVEIRPAAYTLFNSNIEDLFNFMKSMNYKVYLFDNFRLKEIGHCNFSGITTVVFKSISEKINVD